MKKIILLFLVSIVSGSLLIGQNLLTNPGFEDWTTNGAPGPPEDWGLSSGSMTASQEATIFHGGMYSANVTWTTSSTVYLRYENIPVTVGGNYSFSFWVLDNDPAGKARVAIRWFDTGGSFISGYYGDYSADSPDWQEMMSGSQTAPAGAVTATAEVRCYDVSPAWAGTATFYVDDALFENVSADPPVLVNAFSLSSTEVDIQYDKPMTLVDPDDYFMTGTVYTVFSSATVDGTDPTIVHLGGASPAMVGDATLDNISDDNNGTNFDFYAGINPIAFTNTNNPGATLMDGFPATFQGIVSANDGFNNVWVSDNSGQYNGVLVYSSSFDALVAEGDEIIFSAERGPYNNLTEVVNPILINTLSTGNAIYGPDIIPGSDIDENIGADTNPAEAWEGQLVRIEDVTIDSYGDFDFTCSWSDTDADYVFHIGDNVDYQFGTILISVGATYDAIVGVVDWDYDSSYYRINPRYQADIIGAANPATKLAIFSVNNGLDPYTSTDFEVVVQAQDDLNNPALVSGNIDFTFTTDGGDVGNVAFVSGTTTTGTILDGTSEITVGGVQMAPYGTNVTITASDDNQFGGLTQGISGPFDVVDFVFPEIVIVEIMNNPSAVADDKGEWFEVYNNTGAPIDMTGWTMTDSASNTHVIAGPLSVPGGGYAVLGNNADGLTNGGYTCDYEYPNTFYLGNSSDKLILVLPDGVTEIDRVEWDNGATFPDPSGKSMSFAGFITEDNNDGSLWAYTAFREGTYDNSADDRGSPGINGFDQILEGGFKLDMKVFMEGPYESAGTMNNYFRASSELPLAHPFNPDLPYYGNNSPVWMFSGHDTLTYIPYPTTDWVLIELRDATSAAAANSGTMVDQIPALLTDTGTIVAMNGSSPLLIKSSFTYGMFIIVWNMNHLGIMSSVGLSSVEGATETYDFSTGSGQVYGGASSYKELETGVWGMVSGDVNGDQSINAADIVDGWASEAAEAGGYKGSNLHIDDQIDNLDKNEMWVPNMGNSSQVPN